MATPDSPGVLLDHARDKIAVLDGQGRFTYVNAALRRITGREPSSLVGESAFESIHPEDRERVRATFEQTVAGEQPAESTTAYRFRTADGSWVWFESRMSDVPDEGLNGYVVSSRDVTDRVRARRKWEAATTRLAELSAATSEVLWMFDPDWSELLFVNSAYDEVYGQPAERLEGNPQAFLDTVHPQDLPAVTDAMKRVAAGESLDMEYRVTRDDRSDVWVWVQAEPIRENGEVVRIAGFSRDVTERRRRERQLRVMDNLLRHNLRNDMSVVLGNAELIAEETPGAADRTAVIRRTGEALLESAEKEREVIDLLTEGTPPGPVRVEEAVRNSTAAVRERFPEATVTRSLPERSDSVVATAVRRLQAAVTELLENAVLHSTSTEPTVSVEVTVGQEDVNITVEDDAPPIPDMEADVLRGSHEMDDIYHSSGLGLWLVYWVVELSDGEVTVTPADATGPNRVCVDLPRHRD